jgi:hypothetical protein
VIDHEEVARATPGLIGAIAAMFWIKDTWPRRVAYVFVGAASSYYGSGALSTILGTEKGLAGFLIGLFGMAIAAKVFETIESVAPKEVIAAVLKRFGV